MPLEQEIPHMLSIGFITVMSIMIITTLILWTKNKHQGRAYSMICLHLMLLSTAFYFFMNAVTYDYSLPMSSEENSLQIVIAGICWSLSMVFLLLSIIYFSGKKRKQAQRLT
ncbi:hypothetical protein [Jeotgalibacillus aurantiacus]|uniref:hypothetical protein n=1 Tax=Jeotgalibacillus aurantiacus TaxID=2763266 RepID=UPI001D0B0E7E|nr:hypothetical protein [Jeotgalibacillus aurantiacus]